MANNKIPIHIHFTQQQIEALDRIATKAKTSRAELVRHAVSRYLADYKQGQQRAPKQGARI